MELIDIEGTILTPWASTPTRNCGSHWKLLSCKQLFLVWTRVLVLTAVFIDVVSVFSLSPMCYIDSEVSESGDNFSVGERQVRCLRL